MGLITTGLDTQINGMLVLGTGNNPQSDNPNYIFADSSGACGAKNGVCDSYYKAWQSFQRIALGLLVIVGLIILISQALGMEILDAYTIRKMLPRVLIATIAIVLSWQLMRFFVTVSNDLGYGIGSLLWSPFHTLHTQINPSATSVLAGLGIGFSAGAVLDAFGLLSFIGTAAIAVLVTFLVLIVRQIAVILLIIFAPIAILAYVLPNTQRVFRFWWESFSKLLLMFPLIVAFITAGYIFSAISASQSHDFINETIAFIAYFAPYFAIPLTFRLSGAMMSTVGNAINSRGEGARGYLRNVRSNRAKKNAEEYRHKFRTGGFGTIVPARFKRANRLNVAATDKLNKFGRRASAGPIRGGWGFGARGKTASEESLMAGVEAAGKEPGMQQNASINAFNRLNVLTAKHDGNETKAAEDLRTWYLNDRNEYGQLKYTPEQVDEKVSDARGRLRNVGGYTPARAVASYLAMGRDGTAIRDVRDMGDLAASVSEGSATTAYNLISQVGSDSKRLGRSDLSPSQENKAALATATVAAHAGRVVPNHDAVIDRATMSGAGSASGLSVMSDAPARVIRGNVEHALDIIRRHNADPSSVAFGDAAQAASVVVDYQNNADMGYGKPDNKITLNTAMAAEGRQQLLDSFLSGDAPNGTGKVGDHVKRLVGSRYTQLSPDQLQNMSAQQRQQLEQQQQDQQQQQ
jgi:hypothetical protein